MGQILIYRPLLWSVALNVSTKRFLVYVSRLLLSDLQELDFRLNGNKPAINGNESAYCNKEFKIYNPTIKSESSAVSAKTT